VEIPQKADEALLSLITWLRSPDLLPLSALAKDAHERFITESIDKHRTSFDTVCPWSSSSILRELLGKNQEWMELILDKNGFRSACVGGRTEDMRLLYKMRPKTTDSHGDRGDIFTRRCGEGKVEVTELLLALDPAFISSNRNDLVGGVHIACANEQLQIVKLLHGFDRTLITSFDSEGRNCFVNACLAGHVRSVEYLHALDPELIHKTVKSYKSDIKTICDSYNFELLNVLLRMKPPFIQYIIENRKLEFFLAGYTGELENVTSLATLEPGLVEATTEYGYLPHEDNGFLIACERGNIDIVRYFIDNHPQVLQSTRNQSDQDYYGFDMMEDLDGVGLACLKGHYAVAKLMLAQHAVT